MSGPGEDRNHLIVIIPDDEVEVRRDGGEYGEEGENVEDFFQPQSDEEEENESDVTDNSSYSSHSSIFDMSSDSGYESMSEWSVEEEEGEESVAEESDESVEEEEEEVENFPVDLQRFPGYRGWSPPLVPAAPPVLAGPRPVSPAGLSFPAPEESTPSTSSLSRERSSEEKEEVEMKWSEEDLEDLIRFLKNGPPLSFLPPAVTSFPAPEESAPSTCSLSRKRSREESAADHDRSKRQRMEDDELPSCSVPSLGSGKMLWWCPPCEDSDSD